MGFVDVNLAEGVRVRECTTCYSLVDIDSERLHASWHEHLEALLHPEKEEKP